MYVNNNSNNNMIIIMDTVMIPNNLEEQLSI